MGRGFWEDEEWVSRRGLKCIRAWSGKCQGGGRGELGISRCEKTVEISFLTLGGAVRETLRSGAEWVRVRGSKVEYGKH